MSISIAAIILTYNEDKHIARCIKSVSGFCEEVYVVDSYSGDRTAQISEELGAKFFQNPFVNHAIQFNWALENCGIDSEWIFRIDADEFVEINASLKLEVFINSLPQSVNGILIKRKIKFLEQEILHGGWHPKWVMRIFRRGYGKCEDRWMDEHIIITEGTITSLGNLNIVDENLNTLGWWVSKHNAYATKAVVDYFIQKKSIIGNDVVKAKFFGINAERKRWLKVRYHSLPLFIRPFFSFIYYYIFRFGFLDGISGLVWYVLQGFWYRFLIDAKIYELRKKYKNDPNAIAAYMEKSFPKIKSILPFLLLILADFLNK